MAVKKHIFGPVLFLSSWGLSVYWILEIALERKIIARIRPGNIRAGVFVIALIWLVYWLTHLSRV